MNTVPGSTPRLAYGASALVALAAVAGSLALSLFMGLKACPLCFYQRSFAMAALGALLLGLVGRGAGDRTLAARVALLCATAGLGVAAFHVSLEVRGTLECPDGLLRLGSAPAQSLAVFVLLFALLLAAVARPVARRGAALAPALVLGALFAVGSIASSPPLPAPPAAPYAEAPVICRPPFEGP
jgi:hypothetical protein